MLTLTVSSGPDEGCSFDLSEDRPLILGRQGDQHKLRDRKVSRRHARIWLEDGRWLLRDLNSRHGTYLNGQSIGQDIVPISEGDSLRLGLTRIEFSAPIDEQMERAALLGDPLSEKEARRATVMAMRSSRLGPLAVAAAITVVGMLVIYSMLQTRAMNRSLQQQLATLSHKDRQTEPMLRDILARLDDQKQRDAVLSQIRSALTDQPDPTVKLDALLAKVDMQSQQWQALNSLRDDLLHQQRVAAKQSDEKLGQVLAKLDQPRKPDADPQTAEKLDTILAKLDQKPQAPTADPKTTKQLDTILAKLDQPAAPPMDTDQLAAHITEQVTANVTRQLQTAADGDTSASLLKQIVANLDEQHQLSSQIAELRDLIAEQPDQTRQMLADAVSNLATHQDAQTMAAAVDQVRAALPVDASEKLDQVLGKLDTQQSPQQLAAALQTVVEQQTRTQTDSLQQLRKQVDQLADAQRMTPQAILEEIRTATATREKADAKLAELIELANAQPSKSDQTDELLQQVLAELRQRSQGPSDEVLRQVLRELRSKAIAGMDELRAAIRSELDARLGPSAHPVAVAAATSEPQPPLEAPAILDNHAADKAPRRVAMASALLPADSRIGGDAASALSPTELAYKTAFETGQPVTLGSGKLNPLTGEVSEGRALDPAAAKAAGIKTWREWYLMDDFAERMRLQQQASRNNQQSQRDPDLIKLPPPMQTPEVVKSAEQ